MKRPVAWWPILSIAALISIGPPVLDDEKTFANQTVSIPENNEESFAMTRKALDLCRHGLATAGRYLYRAYLEPRNFRFPEPLQTTSPILIEFRKKIPIQTERKDVFGVKVKSLRVGKSDKGQWLIYYSEVDQYRKREKHSAHLIYGQQIAHFPVAFWNSKTRSFTYIFGVDATLLDNGFRGYQIINALDDAARYIKRQPAENSNASESYPQLRINPQPQTQSRPARASAGY